MTEKQSYTTIDSGALLRAFLPGLLAAVPMQEELLARLMTEAQYSFVLYGLQEKNETAAETALSAVTSYLSEHHTIIPFTYGGHSMGLLRHTARGEAMRQETLEIEKAIEDYLAALKAETGADIRLAIGRPFTGLTELKNPYSELVNSTIAFSLRPGTRVISEYDIVADPALLGTPYPRSELERMFADAVIDLEIRKAAQLMEEIIMEEHSSLRLRLSFLPRMSRRVEWVLIILHVPKNSGDRGSDIFTYPARIEFAESEEAGIALIREFFYHLDSYYSAFRFNAGKDISQITGFIREEYSNPNLSATMICDRFRISPSYLSHMFRTRTGVRLVDYINTVRIEEAKKLLSGTADTIAEIAAAAGYSNSGVFSTTFKKYEHMTPRDFREREQRRDEPMNGGNIDGA